MHMSVTPVLIVHICAAAVSLISGALSMLLRKGTDRHRIAGNVFFIAMMVMSSTGAYIAATIDPRSISVIVGILTFYLVTTSWVAARRRSGGTGMFDRIAMLVVLADGIAGVSIGIQEANNPKIGMAPPIYFVFGSIALLFAVSDVRMIARGGVVGAKRIARHLWRMCLAFLITVMSFYPGNARLFSQELRDTKLLFLPLILTAGMTIYWLCRVTFSKAFRASHGGRAAAGVRAVRVHPAVAPAPLRFVERGIGEVDHVLE